MSNDFIGKDCTTFAEEAKDAILRRAAHSKLKFCFFYTGDRVVLKQRIEMLLISINNLPHCIFKFSAILVLLLITA